MLTHIPGFPRMGKGRELKKALESHWRGETSQAELLAEAARIRREHWEVMRLAGLDLVPAGDFSLYDHMLDAAVMLGAVPERFAGAADPLTRYFLMARGGTLDGKGVAPLGMSKWFDTNYHYLAPELSPDTVFSPDHGRLAAEAGMAADSGARAKLVLPGPLTFLYLSKPARTDFDRYALLDSLTEAYAEILRGLSGRCEWIELDEPVLAADLPPALRGVFAKTYARLTEAARPAKIMAATYFGSIMHNLDEIAAAPLAGLHVDLVRAPEQLIPVLQALSEETVCSLGIVNGRNIWRVDAEAALALIRSARKLAADDRLMLATSCSLLHVPMSLDDETDIPERIRRWMAFGVEKCRELRMLADAAQGKNAVDAVAANQAAWETRRAAPELRRESVRRKLAALGPEALSRSLPYPERREISRARHKLPPLPTTVIGSFPQTPNIRADRRDFKRGLITSAEYEERMRGHIREAVEKQESLGLDVLAHGEAERNDMVEYFGERLSGFCFTKNGWVQSYGSRCVKPPVIYGDVWREAPMTVDWSVYAQSITKKPMKGMLTGPVTILRWSFVRDDQPQEETCRQIALAIREEAADLEAAGISVIQIDEPALREGAPLRRMDWDEYFSWAVACFRLAANGTGPEVQLHTHMCYSEFGAIIEYIAAMDADVISIEASRSRMALLDAFKRFRYPNEIGPGVYDIHSPRVPTVEEIRELLRRALEVIPADRLWVNPDCGLKTRGWEETMASLANMVEAARRIRKELTA